MSLDRSEGGGSIHDGSIEIMVHRRTLFDDALGVGEPLNETAYGQGLVVRGRHFLLVDSPSSSAVNHRVASQQLYMHPLATLAWTTLSYADYSTNYRQTWSALTSDLPLNVHLLTFDQVEQKEYLVRLEHYFELNEDPTYSQAVTVDLQVLFQTQGTISDVLELALAANFPLNEMNRLVWTSRDGQSTQSNKTAALKVARIVLNPMQIRTFRVTLE